MGAIGLNPIRLDRIGLDPIRVNAIRLGVPGAASSSDRPYIDPEVLASLKAVCICYGKSNDDPDRAVVKNLVDPDNPFVISNAAFKLNSGFGKYEVDFTSWIQTNGVIASSDKVQNSIIGRFLYFNTVNKKEDVPSFKVNITLGQQSKLQYNYIKEDGTSTYIVYSESGIYTIPASYFSKYTGGNAWFGFYQIEGTSIIEQIPSFEGAFVTDGIDDLITSTKTVQEMLGGSNEITVVSMIHQIKESIYNNRAYTNYISGTNGHIRNQVADTKTGIYGYTVTDLNNSSTNIKGSVINNILGDKNDYLYDANTNVELGNAKYSVQNYIKSDGTVSNIGSQLAWYWTIIANKVLTTDQINQVIAYFNLDRTLKSDIYCNIAKQGITNENHAEFGDKLIDFSGNGRDIQLNNLAWKGDSGIGKYNFSNINIIANGFEGTVTTNKCHFTKKLTNTTSNFCDLLVISPNEPIKFKVSGLSDGRKLFVANKSGSGSNYNFDNGEHEVSLSFSEGVGRNNPFGVTGDIGDIDVTVEFIPSHAGALCLDGVNDFGKVIGMPIYKDYTFISKYQRLSYREAIETEGGAVIASKSYSPNQGAFIFNGVRGDYVHDCYSFGLSSSNNLINDKNLEVYYQTKYTNQGKNISSGTANDSDILWLGTVRDNDTRFINAAIYFLMSFPYSMSEFLIERQLKKHKLGTLYPDMVEFRPVIKANNDYEIVYTAIIKPNNWQEISIGDYVTVGESVAIQIKLNNPLEVTNVSSNSLADVSFYKEETGDNVYTIYGRLLDGKSPQKISLTIEQDENYVLFKPTINSNAIFEVGNEETMPELFTQLNNGEIDGIILYMQGDKAVLPNNWIDKNTKVRAIIYCLDTVSEEDIHFTVDGKTKYCYSAIEDGLAAFGIMDEDSQEEQYMTNVLTANTIDIQIDQYIRYEDIVQPYPVLLRFNDENGNEVSWGGKFRVGSTITRIGSFYENNLLDGLYTVRNPKLNGNNLITPTHVVEKSMVFTCDTEYLLDNNEPKVILSPRLLRIPNSSYKILGYIPDISGNGNHGKINNSAYAEGSGVNEDGSYQFDGVDDFVTIPTLSSGGKQVLMKVNWNTLNEIIYDQRGNSNDGYTFAIFASDEDNAIAYSGRNKGETYIDGILNNNILASQLKQITHNITISNKDVNSNNSTIPYIGRSVSSASYSKMALYDFMLFDDISTDDKIKELNEYVGIEAKVELPPYYWDNYGKTNLDEDKNYTANLGTVKDVIEVSKPAIFAENWYDYYESLVSRSPIINQTDYSIEVKPTHMDSNFMMMLSVDCDTPLPAFRAKFTRTSNVDVSYAEIRYVYYVNGKSTYIDIFGENNSAESVILDIPASEKSSISGSNADNFPNILIEVLPADNSTFYGLTNTNFAYDKMSGFGGYSLGRFDKSWSSSSSNNTSVVVVLRNPYDITLKKLGGNSDWEFNTTELKIISNPVSVKFKSDKNIIFTCDYHYYTVGGNSEGTPLGITSKDLIANEDTIITISPISQENIDKYNIDINRGYYLVYFQLSSTLAVNEEVTIEMLPLYPNGLVYDGVTDYSNNNNIPAFTDYTYIIKRQILKGVANSAVMYKGNVTVNQGGAFICNYCEPSNVNMFTDFSFGGLFRSNNINNPIIYSTKTSINGNNITPGEKIDTTGINIGKWVNYLPIVFYKLILYPKTIPLLQINFLKNLMERDEIIDLNNKIFIRE